MNPDPLVGLPEQERLLFDAFERLAAGKQYDAVLGACINIMINAIRQREPTRAAAEMRWDMFFGRGKTLLLEKNYDSVTGRRRTVFPFTQVVQAAFHNADDEVRG